jgi:hypothetical protein
MRALVMGPEEEASLKRLRDHAEVNRIDVDELLDIYNRKAPPVGDRNGYDCDIPVGYRVVFCIEHQTKGWARHMSVSIRPAERNQCAHPEAIKWLMAQLGFAGEMNGKDVMVYFENQNTVVNVVEYIKE